MPYKDPEKQRAAQAASYRRRYADPEFAAQEAERKAEWRQTEGGLESNRKSARKHWRRTHDVQKPTK